MQPLHRGLLRGRADSQKPWLCVADSSAPDPDIAVHTPAVPRQRRPSHLAASCSPAGPAYAPSPSSLWVPRAGPVSDAHRPLRHCDCWRRPGLPAVRPSPPDWLMVGFVSGSVCPRIRCCPDINQATTHNACSSASESYRDQSH